VKVALACICILLAAPPAPLSAQRTDIPPAAIIEAAHNIAAALLGDSVSAVALGPDAIWTHFTARSPDCSSNCLWPWWTDYYTVVFPLRLATDTSLASVVAIAVDTLGRQVQGTSVFGAPDCRQSAEPCRLEVTEASARRAAAEAGLTIGSGRQFIRLVWSEWGRLGTCTPCTSRSPMLMSYAGPPRYVWVVAAEQSPRSWTEYIVNASTGAVEDSTRYSTGH
jgi:hypothetical protein